MYVFIFVIIFTLSYCDIQISIDSFKGNYNISINNRVWLRSSYTSLYSNNQWYSSKDGSLLLIDRHFNQGNDFYLGQWNETEFIYYLNINGKESNISGRIRQWNSISAISFYFDCAQFDLNNDILLDMDRVRTVFPSFNIEQIDHDDHRGYLTFGGILVFFILFS